MEQKEDSAGWETASLALPRSGGDTRVWQLLAEYRSYLLKIPTPPHPPLFINDAGSVYNCRVQLTRGLKDEPSRAALTKCEEWIFHP